MRDEAAAPAAAAAEERAEAAAPRGPCCERLVLGARDWSWRLLPGPTAPPALLMPVLGKPWIFHVIEAWVGRGAREIALAGAAGADALLAAIGDGTRWGVRVAPEPWDLCWRGHCANEGPLAGCHYASAHELPVDDGGCPLRLGSPAGYLALDHPRTLLRARALLIEGQAVEPGVVIARNVAIHPTARIVPPVYLGANVRIGRGAVIGPDAAIHAGCLVSAEARVARASVQPGTYIGDDLALEDAIARPGWLLDLETGAGVRIADDFILGAMDARLGILPGWLRRCARRAREAAGLLQARSSSIRART